jgi:hypothetical protein
MAMHNKGNLGRLLGEAGNHMVAAQLMMRGINTLREANAVSEIGAEIRENQHVSGLP